MLFEGATKRSPSFNRSRVTQTDQRQFPQWTVRAWRFSYNARGIIEMPNRLAAKETAVIMVYPRAIDDEWGWKSPEPNGAADFCTPRKNAVAAGTTVMGFGTCRSR